MMKSDSQVFIIFLFLFEIIVLFNFIMNDSLVKMFIPEFFITFIVYMESFQLTKIVYCFFGERNWIEVKLLHIPLGLLCGIFKILEIIDIIKIL